MITEQNTQQFIFTSFPTLCPSRARKKDECRACSLMAFEGSFAGEMRGAQETSLRLSPQQEAWGRGAARELWLGSRMLPTAPGLLPPL